MQTLRAARLPGQSTLWTRTLERFLRRMPDRGPEAALGLAPGQAVPRAAPHPADVLAAVVPVAAAHAPAPHRTWTAPRRLPELLTDPHGERRSVRLAAVP